MENNINGFYIEASEKAYKLLVKLGVDTKGASYDHHVNTMGANTFLVNDNHLQSTDGDPLKFKWFKNPKKVVLDDLKKIYREENPDITLNNFVKKLELKEVPNFQEYEEIFEQLKKYLFKLPNEGLSIKFAFGLKDRIVEEFSSFQYDKMSDRDIKQHLEQKYSNIFKENLKNCDHNKIISYPIYSMMIVDLSYVSEKGKTESFKYLLDNINLNDFDIDMTTLAHAVKNSRNTIVEQIIDYVKAGNKYDGSYGKFKDRLQQVINDKLSNLDLDLQDKVVETFDWAKKPKFDWMEAARSQTKSREEKMIEQYKTMFPGLNFDR